MNFFGLDVGTNSIKLVQLTNENGKFRLISFGMCASPLKGFSSESVVDLELLAETIKRLVRDAKLNTNNVATALSETQVYTRVITTPPLSMDELTLAIRWEAEQYIPLPLADVRLDYQIISEADKKTADAKTEVLLVAAPISTINKYLKVMELANLKSVLLETEIISIARALVPPAEVTTLLVNLGATNTEIAIVKNGVISFTRSITTGGNALARAVATELGLEIAQAEEYKKSYGMDETKLSGKVQLAIKPIFDVIVAEMKKGIAFYQNEKSDNVGRVVLSGGTARLPGVVSYLAETLGIEVIVGDPFLNIKINEEQRKTIAAEGALFSTAIGLAMKPF